jgi:flagellar hook protein FlgE
MSLFGALTTGVSGMNAQSRAMGNISENLANTQTTAYKRADTRFAHLVTNSSARNNAPGGVIATPAYQNSIQGTLLSTQSATDLAITGGGFFAIADSATSAKTSYSRRGDFALDKDGYMVNGAGQFLRGWSITNPAATSGWTANTSSSNPIQVSQAPVPASQTTTLDYLANLPSNAAAGTDFVSTAQVYDQFGNVNNLSLRWVKATAVAPSVPPANTWNLNIGITDESGTRTNLFGQAFTGTAPPAASVTAAQPFVFGDGSAATVPAGTLASINAAGTAGAAATIALTAPFGTGTSNVTLNFGNFASTAGTTQYADTNAQVSVRTLSQNGYGVGQFRDLAVSDDGFVTANYTNGTTRTLYQIPLASFPSPNQLQRLDAGAYAPTLDSGLPILSAAGVGGTGTLSGNALEGSNVDVADEFSKMIVTQRIFSANARSITTSDEMLTEVVNLKR